VADAVLYETRGKTAYITLNRPEAMNAINAEVLQGLADAWMKVRDDPEVWTAIVTGAGDKAFSAGADLKSMSERRATSDKGEVPPLLGFISSLEVWKPFIAAINGYCLGGGLELALICDIRVATERAIFGFPEVTRAIIPSGGGTQRLPRMVPFGIALESLLTGNHISPQEAYRFGLVNRVVSPAELMPAAEAIASKINENGPLAVRAIKEAAHRGMNMPLDQGLRLENLLSHVVRATEDSREGPSAFAEKRKPVYKGK
jgi:enoyl-CoA hydratase/carnithine racemase